MKKSLLALAVLTAFAGAASAQSSVTLYGKIDLGGVLESGSAKGKVVRISTGVTGGSRLGFKGVEDLGGGLKAGFQIETGFCADSNTNNAGTNPNFCTGGNNFGGRQSHVDLVGNFGAVTLGRQYTLAFINLTTIDPFGTGLAGQTTNLFDSAGSGAGNPRVNNSAIYTTPNLNGFQAAALVAFGETQGDWRTGRANGLSATYASGPLYLGAAYHSVNGTAGVLGRKNTNFGGTYDLGAVKVHALMQSTKAAAAPYKDTRDSLLGLSAPVGNGTVLASIIKHDDRTVADQNANQIGVGYMYALSKRTSVYSAFARIKNEHGATFTVGNATDAGTGNKAFDLGVVHNF